MFHISLLEPYRESSKGFHPPPVAITERKVDKSCKPDKSFIDNSGTEHEVRYDVDGQRVYGGFFNVDEIMGSQYNTKKVLYLIKWEGYPDESEWTEKPLGHLPRKLVEEFHKRHPGATMDNKLTKARK